MNIKNYNELESHNSSVWRVTMQASKFRFTVKKEEGLIDSNEVTKSEDAWNDCLLFDNENEAQLFANALNAIFRLWGYQE